MTASTVRAYFYHVTTAALLDVRGDRIVGMTSFLDVENLFPLWIPHELTALSPCPKGPARRRARPEGRHVRKPGDAVTELSCPDVEAPVRARTARLPGVLVGRPTEDHIQRPSAAIRAAQSDRGWRLENLPPSAPALTVERRKSRGARAACAHGRTTYRARWRESRGGRIPLEGI